MWRLRFWVGNAFLSCSVQNREASSLTQRFDVIWGSYIHVMKKKRLQFCFVPHVLNLLSEHRSVSFSLFFLVLWVGCSCAACLCVCVCMYVWQREGLQYLCTNIDFNCFCFLFVRHTTLQHPDFIKVKFRLFFFYKVMTAFSWARMRCFYLARRCSLFLLCFTNRKLSCIDWKYSGGVSFSRLHNQPATRNFEFLQGYVLTPSLLIKSERNPTARGVDPYEPQQSWGLMRI